jgi:hypothetical protein
MPFSYHATTIPFWKRPLKATAQRGTGTAWYVWISNGRPEPACGRPPRVRLLPATTRSSMKVVTRSRLAVRMFPSTTRTFTKDTALSENGRVVAWHVWINAACERHGMCELAWRRPVCDNDSALRARPECDGLLSCEKDSEKYKVIILSHQTDRLERDHKVLIFHCTK